MLIGVVTWELHVAGCRSLKEKRKVIKSLKDRLHQRFNVSVSETGHLDRWQRAELACCAVAGDRRHLESVLSAAENLVEAEPRARLIESSKQFL